ncbi:MAG: acyl-CoA dehydrogenase family protein [Geminicoccaceae bacterium]
MSETTSPFTLPEAARAWQAKVRPFADALIPHEVEAEMAGGSLPKEVVERHRAMAAELRLAWMDVPREHGGLELPSLVQAAVWEVLGRVTNALAWVFSEPQRWMFAACDQAQIERWILPLAKGTRREAYAITEEGAGSDVATLRATARRDGDEYVLDGEKWYVTGGNKADFLIFQARLDGGDHCLFFVDLDRPGIELVRSPAFSHNYSAHHPIYRFHGVRVPVSCRIGAEGEGLGFTFEWFRRERLMIAARCCGAAARLIEEVTEFARTREVAGGTLLDQQATQMVLADCVTELHAARLLTYEAAAAEDSGIDKRQVHARASIAKLYGSEMVGRVADRAVQLFGGRGYMRENVAERFFREVRVDRIWEGTSEIQRLIIAGALKKRGLEGVLG